jgi:hypothetical protein
MRDETGVVSVVSLLDTHAKDFCQADKAPLLPPMSDLYPPAWWLHCVLHMACVNKFVQAHFVSLFSAFVI